LQKRPIILSILLTKATPYKGDVLQGMQQCMYVCARISCNSCTSRTHMHCIHMYVYIYICIYMYIYIHIYVHINMSPLAHTYPASICIYTYICLYIYTYICTYKYIIFHTHIHCTSCTSRTYIHSLVHRLHLSHTHTVAHTYRAC